MTSAVQSWLRFLSAAALLVVAAFFLRAHSKPEALPSRAKLDSFPMQLGGWVGQDEGISPEILEALGPGEFLSRVYHRAPEGPPIDFFLAYFPSQRTGDTIHSPKNCLPGAGWTPLESGRISLARPGASPITVNRYIIGQGTSRLLVLYWYQAHGRAVASEYWAKFCLVADAARLNRTDGALVRIITPIAPGESAGNSQQRAAAFAQEIFPALGAYIPD